MPAEGRRRQESERRRLFTRYDRKDRRCPGDVPPIGESLLAGLAMASLRSGPRWRHADADGRAAGHADKFAEALAACRLARADQEVLAAVPGASNDARLELAVTIDLIGWLLWNSGKPAEAVPEFRTALRDVSKADRRRAQRHRVPSRPGRLPLLSRQCATLTGNAAEGEAEFRASLEIQQKLVDENPAVTWLRRSLALFRNWFGELLLQMGKPAEAEAECRKAMAIVQKVVTKTPPSQTTAAFWRVAIGISVSCFCRWASRRRRRPSAARRRYSTRSWRTTTPPSSSAVGSSSQLSLARRRGPLIWAGRRGKGLVRTGDRRDGTTGPGGYDEPTYSATTWHTLCGGGLTLRDPPRPRWRGC